MKLKYHVVDVFTETPLEGNALAVFPHPNGLDGALMQRIARELNLSETTFVLPPQSACGTAHVRIFTPNGEMRFAGHPTIGTAAVMRTLGLVARDRERFVLDELVGPVTVRVDDGADPLIWLETPPIERAARYDVALAARALGLTAADVLDGVIPQLLSAGNPNIYVAVRDRATVDRARVDTAALDDLIGGGDVCLFVFAPTEEGAYSRMFAPGLGVVEDPATGSATGPLALYMMDNGLLADADGTRFVSEQGTKMGRRSRLHGIVRGVHGATTIEIGGHVVPVATATMML